ncbi:hypothetical protein HYY74_01185 [Candidatus Woesearchaeota archaeon]|nr:hypothetical protein [Candidatus Woesearchaeota archaeon]
MVQRNRLRQWARDHFALQRWFNELARWCFEKKLPLLIIAIAGLATLLLFSLVKGLLIISFFIGLGAASLQYNRFIRTSLGIELITIGVVITGRLYGPGVAVFVGFVSLFLGELLSGSLQHKTVVSFIAIVAIGLLTQNFAGASIAAEGIWLIVIYDIIIAPGYLLLGSNPLRTGIFVVTHIAFGIWLFTAVAPFVHSFFA